MTKTLKKAIAYVRQQLDEDDIAIIHANINKAYRAHLMPENLCDYGKVMDLLEEYGEDNDLPEGWWEEECDINDILFEL
mgnify:CR=1 FL=1